MRTRIPNMLSPLALAVLVCIGASGAIAAPAAPAHGHAAAVTGAAPARGAARHFQLETGIVNGKMVFIDESGRANPVLRANVGDTVEIKLKSGEGAQHDIAIPELKEELELNVELAVPGDFVPMPNGWEERSPFVEQVGTERRTQGIRL